MVKGCCVPRFLRMTIGDEATNIRVMIGLATEQIATQLDQISGTDAMNLGVIGFETALGAACIAAQHFEGIYWWGPLFGLGASILISGWAAAERRFELGPDPARFFARYGGLLEFPANQQLLADLTDTLGSNRLAQSRKARRMAAGVTMLIVTLIATAFLFPIAR